VRPAAFAFAQARHRLCSQLAIMRIGGRAMPLAQIVQAVPGLCRVRALKAGRAAVYPPAAFPKWQVKKGMAEAIPEDRGW